MFEYKAHLVRVIDGDTVDLEVDLGFRVSFQERFRLNRINAPEVKGDERTKGIASTNKLRDLIAMGEITIKTIKDEKEKYGRYLVEIYVDGQCINDVLVHEGFAEYKQY